MALKLRIENETNLPDGGPLSVTVEGKRGIDIGRDQYLDWTLPDPSRFISGKHCEIRWHDGGYWLHDVSTNGTFLYGADGRLKEPHRLSDGDRFAIGHYIIVADVDDEGAGGEAHPAAGPPRYEELWDGTGDAAPPIDPKQLKAPRDLKPVRPDFLDWAVDVPPPPSDPSAWEAPPAAPAHTDEWSRGRAFQPPPPPEPPAVPNPRRPVYVTGEPGGPWAGSAGPERGESAAANVLAAAQALSASAAPAQPARQPPRPAPPPPAAPAIAQPMAPIDPGAVAEFIRLFARGAGLPEDALASRNPAELALELGQLMRLVAENMRQLLEARQQAKRLARSANQTMIQATGNNPLKFAPTVEDAMRIMFGPQTRSYVDGRRALAESFDDLKAHQVKTFSAMQHALKLLLQEFDPEVLEASAKGDRGLAGVVGSRKARLWDVYVARWQARTEHDEDGLLKAFMDHFADCYDRE
jgi:type VI secretion system protein ImpI